MSIKNNLLLDLGNTALKWTSDGQADEPKIYVHRSTGQIPDNIAREWIEGAYQNAYGCTVASKWMSAEIDEILEKNGVKCHWLGAQRMFEGRFTLLNQYSNPYLLGADRWHAAIGAVTLFPQTPLLIVHMGTASTVDSVVPLGKSNYSFLGGRIAPGPEMMKESLCRGTAHLPFASGAYSDFPQNTKDAITTGVIDCQLGIVHRALCAMRRQGVEPQIILAGGAAGIVKDIFVQEFANVVNKHNLVLFGIRERIQ
jgi:type III pantothenate kinase